MIITSKNKKYRVYPIQAGISNEEQLWRELSRIINQGRNLVVNEAQRARLVRGNILGLAISCQLISPYYQELPDNKGEVKNEAK